jgi:hypothetical protein
MVASAADTGSTSHEKRRFRAGFEDGFVSPRTVQAKKSPGRSAVPAIRRGHEQVGSSNGGPRPSLNSGFHLAPASGCAITLTIVEEDHGIACCSVRFSAESPARLCAWVSPSLCRVSGLGCVLGFCRVFAESLAQVVRLGSAESSQSLRSHPHPGFPFTIKA